MHHIYHTEAFVIKTRPQGEDSKIITLYTRELGLIYAHAQGIRKLSSKLRFVIQEHRFISVDLVRGKEIWRITTAQSSSEYFPSEDIRYVFSRMGSLIARLCHGEEESTEAFDALVRARELLSIKGSDRKVIELLSAARILIALGYLSRDILEEGEDVFSRTSYQHSLAKRINEALSLSHL